MLKIKNTLLVLAIIGLNTVYFHLLTALSKARLLLPARTADRFARSAAKRDPAFVTMANMKAILEAPTFQPDFCLGKQAKKIMRATAARRYLSQSHSGVDPRKPEPGFHPGVFAAEFGGNIPVGMDPYAAFLRHGRPDGVWCSPVIVGGPDATPVARQVDTQLALHIHAYYVAQLPQIIAALSHNQSRPDLFVSLRAEEDRTAAQAALQAYNGVVVDISVFPNAGRDIGPMLSGFGTRLIEDYEIVGHVHTKQSLFAKNADWVMRWVRYSYANVLGSQTAGRMADRILAAMAKDPKIGLIYPEDPHIIGYGENVAHAVDLSKKLGLGPLPEHFSFPVGTMFWMRGDVLKLFVDLNLDWADYPIEPVPSDGTMLHALERLFGALPPLAGWKTVLTHTVGILR